MSTVRQFSIYLAFIVVFSACKKPSTACFDMSSKVVTVGQTVVFTSCSKCTNCSDHNKVSDLQWDFGDGTSGSGTPIEHIYNTAGQFTIILTSNDSDHDAKASVTHVLTVFESFASTHNDVQINFTNVVGNSIVRISKDTAYTGITPKYINANSDTFSVTRLNYYISNIRLKNSDGSYFTDGNYYLVDAKDSINTCHLTLKNVPTGNYVSLEYIVGVDSLRNCSGAQTGPLDPIHDMFWSWNQGYIFFKFEGYTSSDPPLPFHNVQYDVGGFLTPYNNIKKITFPLISPNLIVGTSHISTVYIKTDILEAFKTPTTIHFGTLAFIASPQTGTVIANNYVDMFSLSAIYN